MRATILVPTYNHGRTLWYSVRSALAQTISEIEIFIVGDGISDEGRTTEAPLFCTLTNPTISKEFGKAPTRVRVLFKDPRHGTTHLTLVGILDSLIGSR
jgi:glycosyltransferase involved in cell wall biosynthesis